MSLKLRIDNDLKAALLSGDRFAVDTLRFLKAAVLTEEVAKGKRQDGLSDDEIIQLLAKECKKREESAAFFVQGGNEQSAAKERSEKEFLMKYMPEQLSADEVESIVDQIIAEIKPEGVKDMGKVIGAVRLKVGATADGSLIAQLVKQKLSN